MDHGLCIRASAFLGLVAGHYAIEVEELFTREFEHSESKESLVKVTNVPLSVTIRTVDPYAGGTIDPQSELIHAFNFGLF
jgi:hypothetical protein